jgi:hypothetical protein
LTGTAREAKYYAESESTGLIKDLVSAVDLDVYFDLVLLGHSGHELEDER